MRVEQIKPGVYVKKPTNIEQYLMRVIQRFFDTDEESINSAASREAIINEATRRAGSETVKSIQQIVIDETDKYATNELNAAIDAKLASIVAELNSKVDEIVGREISSCSFVSTATSDNFTFPVPENCQMVKTSQDIILTFVNGMIHEAPKLSSSAGKFVELSFPEGELFKDDVVMFYAIMLNPEG